MSTDLDQASPNAQRACTTAWMSVTAMVIALIVTSIMTVSAGAQLPSTSTGADGDTTGARAGGTAGLIVLGVVFVVVVGGVIVLYLRHRSNKP